MGWFLFRFQFRLDICQWQSSEGERRNIFIILFWLPFSHWVLRLSLWIFMGAFLWLNTFDSVFLCCYTVCLTSFKQLSHRFVIYDMRLRVKIEGKIFTQYSLTYRMAVMIFWETRASWRWLNEWIKFLMIMFINHFLFSSG